MSVRRRAQVLFLVLSVVGSLAIPTVASAAPCTSTDLAPALIEGMANQGLPYTTLVRGKDTIVRFYLMMPACSAGTTATIQITGAKLAAQTSTGTSLGAEITSPLDALNTSPAPDLMPFQSDPAIAAKKASNSSPSNPRFSLSESYLKPAITGAFTAAFKATVNFSFDTNGPAVPGGTGTGSREYAVSAPVQSATASLRVLAVPMGNPTLTTPFAGGTNLTAGFGTLGRVFPVADGVGNVGEKSSATGGILWRQAGSTMDVTSLMTGGKLCVTGQNWQTLQGMLAARLEQQNSANTDPKASADRVVGVVDTASSTGSGEGACSDGYAAMNGKESFVRTPTGATGALLAMESAHNSGAVTPLRQNVLDTTHAARFDADAGLNRGYELAGNSYLADDKSALNSQDFGVWNNGTVLLEKHDWEQAFCRLGGPQTIDCINREQEGAIFGSASGGYSTRSILVGLTDGTPEDENDTGELWVPGAPGTHIFDAYYGPVPATTVPASGEYRFVQLGASGNVLSDLPVAVQGIEGHHGGGTETDQHFFSIAYPFQSSAARWELWKGPFGAGTRLAGRDMVGVPIVGQPMIIATPGQPRGVGFDDQTPLLAPSVDGVEFNSEARVVADPTTSSLPNALLNLTAVDAPLTIDFAEPVFDVGMKIGNGLTGTDATLEALNADGDVVDSAEASGFGKAVSTSLSVGSSAGDIVSARLTYSQADGAPAPPEEIDDLTFTPGVGGGLVDVESTATTNGDPRHLRGAFFTRCTITGSTDTVNVPVAAALKPYRIDGQTGHFRFRWDSASACENGGVATLLFRAADGYTISAFSEPAHETATDTPPVAAILSPRIDAALLEHQQLSLSGQAYDSTDGVLPGSHLSWFVSGPGFAQETLVGTGNELDVAPPNGFSWATGGYTVRLTATDFDGNVAETSAEVLIEPDADNDGISAANEQCYAGSGDPTPDNNPFNAFKDFDTDGFANVDDAEACVPAGFYEMIGDFDPNTLFIPSSGNPVTFYVKSPNRALTDVATATVRISRIQGATISPSDPIFNGNALSWQVNSSGIGIAKFDRQKLTSWLDAHDLENKFPNLTITGSGTSLFNGVPFSWTFEANDITNAKPAK